MTNILCRCRPQGSGHLKVKKWTISGTPKYCNRLLLKIFKSTQIRQFILENLHFSLSNWRTAQKQWRFLIIILKRAI